MTPADPIQFLRSLFAAAVKAADPRHCLAPHLPPPGAGRTLVVGAGKAAGSMAAALEAAWQGDPARLSGLVVTRYGCARPTRRIEVVEAAHPVPDEAGVDAAERIQAMVRGLSADDQVIALISGGGSALLAAPALGVSLADKRAVTEALLRSGAPIEAINCVRKHLSALKGGRLAQAAHPARVITLAISDVVGDDPSVIASGPTVPDPSTRDEARAILRQYQINAPSAVWHWLEAPQSETPKPGDAGFERDDYRIIARPAQSLAAAVEAAETAGIGAVCLGDAVEGEAREVAKALGGIARACRTGSGPARPPCVLISGGETSVTLPPRGKGHGGRNSEFLLALACHLRGAAGIWALAADTDGQDGTDANAGAWITPDTLSRATTQKLDPAQHLAAHDAWHFFSALGNLLVTGPSLTNVNDFRGILII